MHSLAHCAVLLGGPCAHVPSCSASNCMPAWSRLLLLICYIGLLHAVRLCMCPHAWSVSSKSYDLIADVVVHFAPCTYNRAAFASMTPTQPAPTGPHSITTTNASHACPSHTMRTNTMRNTRTSEQHLAAHQYLPACGRRRTSTHSWDLLRTLRSCWTGW